MAVLKVGSHGPEVKRLQEALNAKLRPSPNLAPDGVYGNLTRAAVLRFQQTNWLVEDGEAGQATQACAFGLETSAPILHDVAFIPQPTPTQCWAASTAMMTRSSVPAVVAKTPPEMITQNGGLANASETDQGLTAGRRYGRIHGLRCNAPQSWAVSTLRSALRGGPLMFDMLWDAGEYTAGRGSSGHMIVVVGIRGDDDPSGLGTTLRVHDPWPPNQGQRASRGYFKWIQRVPAMTYRVFER